MNKQDFPMEGPNSFRECKAVAESLGCVVKLRGRATAARAERSTFLTIHGPQCLAVYDMFIGVARIWGQDMSKVLLPHEGTLRRLQEWRGQLTTVQALETDGNVDAAGAADQQQTEEANMPAPAMDELPGDDDEEDGIDWGPCPPQSPPQSPPAAPLPDVDDASPLSTGTETEVVKLGDLRLQSVEREPLRLPCQIAASGASAAVCAASEAVAAHWISAASAHWSSAASAEEER